MAETITVFDCALTRRDDGTYQHAVEAPGGEVWIKLSETQLTIIAESNDTTSATTWIEFPFHDALPPQARASAVLSIATQLIRIRIAALGEFGAWIQLVLDNIDEFPEITEESPDGDAGEG